MNLTSDESLEVYFQEEGIFGRMSKCDYTSSENVVYPLLFYFLHIWGQRN